MIPKLQSEVFLRNDLEAILRAIVVASDRVSNSPHDAARRQGFAQAIVAMAVAIHVELPDELYVKVSQSCANSSPNLLIS